MKNHSTMQTHSITSGLTIAVLTTALSLNNAPSANAAYGYLNLADGWRCEGQFQGNNGQGVCVRRDEVDPGTPYKYYRGTVQNGTFAGRGVLVYENDDRYEGQVQNGRPNGQGTFISVKDNQRYQGSFRNGEFHGRGTYTFGNGSRYVGQFAGGQPHGIGTYTVYNDGKVAYTYTGSYYLGAINGKGVVTDARGVRCTGVFYSNTLVGKGTCVYPSSGEFKTYTGELKNGLPDGRGTATYRNGKRYTGEFRNGFPGLSTTGAGS